MAPLPDCGARTVRTSLLPTNPSSTPPEGINLVELKVFVTPSLLPSPPTAPSELPVPAGFEFKPPEPEKELWLEISSLQSTDVYEELISNKLNYNRKRSGMILFSFSGRDAYTANP